jgi:hypothetical protein
MAPRCPMKGEDRRREARASIAFPGRRGQDPAAVAGSHILRSAIGIVPPNKAALRARDGFMGAPSVLEVPRADPC